MSSPRMATNSTRPKTDRMGGSCGSSVQANPGGAPTGPSGISMRPPCRNGVPPLEDKLTESSNDLGHPFRRRVAVAMKTHGPLHAESAYVRVVGNLGEELGEPVGHEKPVVRERIHADAAQPALSSLQTTRQ